MPEHFIPVQALRSMTAKNAHIFVDSIFETPDSDSDFYANLLLHTKTGINLLI